ncbi:NupC/NupG family nucleoside CNT transporter [Saccharopolyspora sp. HNM0983]|uniref:NupC/NupG family nucleoside CNT transporter n=2 Tax=Saccharopolyspora montiporae TaxID=2781240 RepID=A0A929BBP6_9PSEU|nr:nucleoside transporter C-terminal domain-containing protein [Saccharopolyspora sp. HNM0983]MBE9375901.1 NupC/NupG family nucleoside CNT transporter [Saccharopolyspora sp. HNM0983]
MLVVLLLAFALSTDRRSIRPRTVLGALAIQIVFAVLVLATGPGGQVLGAVAGAVQDVIDSSEEGIEFMVGPILPSEGTVVAFQVLPVIVFVSSLTAVLYYLNVLQWVVRIIGGGLRKVLGTTRPESLNATANIFLGQTEAPLVIRPYLARMTRSEFFAVMVGGLSTVAGSVMVGYALMGASLENLIAASFMAAPAGLLMAKIIMPEPRSTDEAAQTGPDARTADSTTADTGGSDTDDDGTSSEPEDSADEDDTGKPTNVIDAAASGASDGLRLALNVGAMLFAFVSLVALINLIIGAAGGLFGVPELTLQEMLGYLFSPLMFVIGVPWDEAVQAGSFVGQKLVINEFLAFSEFGPRIGEFSEKTTTIVTFALTGFANIGSLGILLGGLGGLVPSKRSWIARDGVRALLAGTLANLLSATIAGVLI